MNAENLYEPVIIENFQGAGITAQAAGAGEKATVITKMFISSLDSSFPRIASNILSSILQVDPSSSLNSLLVIIKADNKAYIYNNFPFALQAIVKRNIEANTAVFKKDIADIISVSFKTPLIDINPQDGERIIWLFRENWNFGLFFDFTGQSKTEPILKEMGFHYRKLAYLSEYLFFENSNNFEQMMRDGWFPFVTLIGDGIDKIRSYYEEGEKHPSIVEQLLKSFDQTKLMNITSRWWSNPFFNSKKKILQAGINSYLTNTEDGYINSVKNFSTELEGIIRVAYYQDYGKNPGSLKDLKEYISNKGQNKFTSLGSLCFPDRFLEYLNSYIFRPFDVKAGQFPESRHSVAHGVAQNDVYSQEFALKLILTLDNIHFFLGN